MRVGHAIAMQGFGKRFLREALLARQGQFAQVDDRPHAGFFQPGYEGFDRQSLIAKGAKRCRLGHGGIVTRDSITINDWANNRSDLPVSQYGHRLAPCRQRRLLYQRIASRFAQAEHNENPSTRSLSIITITASSCLRMLFFRF
jgi:hypothetical protein